MHVFINQPVRVRSNLVFVLVYSEINGQPLWAAFLGDGVRGHCQRIIPSYQLLATMEEFGLVNSDVCI